MAVRFIAIDIDGTLLDGRGRLPDANAAAIAEALQRGIEVALVTGRSFHFSRPIAQLLPDPLTLIVSNGALVKATDGTTLMKRFLDRDAARTVLTETRAFRPHAAVIFDRELANQIVCEGMDWEHPHRRGYYARMRECIGEVPSLEAALTEDPIQIMFNGSVEPIRALQALLNERARANRVHIALTEYVSRDFSLLDVMTEDCSKGTTLGEWTRQRGYTRDEVMAIGDNYNDVEMLEAAGVPVVMGNAVEELKQQGWPVTATNEEYGLALAIQRFAFR